MIWVGGDLIAGAIRHSRELALMVAEAEGSLRLRLSGRPRRQEGAKLRILAYSSSYLPDHRGGSEVTLHRLLQALRSRRPRDDGHDRHRFQFHRHRRHRGPGRARSQRGARTVRVVRRRARTAEVAPARGVPRRARTRVRYAYYVQIGNSSTATLAGEPDLTLFSSQFVRDQYPQAAPALVVHPVVPEPEYVTTPGECATLINLAEIKGGAVFFELARQLPDRQFLGVRGWGPQVTAPPLPNTTLIGTQPDVRDVYSRTCVLLMPSGYESYGRVAARGGDFRHPDDRTSSGRHRRSHGRRRTVGRSRRPRGLGPPPARARRSRRVRRAVTPRPASLR